MEKQLTGKVLPGKILVEPDSGEIKTQAGIIIPDLEHNKPRKGTVVAVGASTDKVEIVLAPGDRVLYSQHAGEPLDLDDDELDLHGDFLVMNQTQVLIFKTANK